MSMSTIRMVIVLIMIVRRSNQYLQKVQHHSHGYRYVTQ